MQKRFGIIITLGFFMGMAILLHAGKTAPRAPIVGPVIVFGDSLVAGVGATEGHDFVSILSRRLGMEIINAGIPGDTTEDLLNRLHSDVSVRDPGLVVVLVGGNDYLRSSPKQTTLQNIRSIIEGIQQTGAEVVLVGVSRLVYDKDYEAIAKDEGIEYVPHILDWTVSRRLELMSDSVHPNDRGYEVFADKIEPVIRKLLDR
jgi:acyl-CoA thioesterase I